MCKAPKKQAPSDSAQIVLSMGKQHVSQAAWNSAVSQPRAAMKQWLEAQASVEMLDARPPYISDGKLQTVCWVPKKSRDACLKVSGQDGVFVNPFLAEDADRQEFKAVPLEPEVSLSAALRQAQFNPQAVGVVCMKKGFGLRVLAAKHEELLRHVHQDAAGKFLGGKYEVTGLPLSVGAEGVKEFLAPWSVHPVTTFRRQLTRTWVVRAEKAPTERILQHDYGIAVIQDVVFKQAAAKPRMVWNPTKAEMPQSRTKPATTWAARLQGAESSRSRERVVPAATAREVQPAAAPAAVAVEPPRTAAYGPPCSGSSSQDMAAIVREAVKQAMDPLQKKVESLQQEMAAMKVEAIFGKDVDYSDNDVVADEEGELPSGDEAMVRSAKRSAEDSTLESSSGRRLRMGRATDARAAPYSRNG